MEAFEWLSTKTRKQLKFLAHWSLIGSSRISVPRTDTEISIVHCYRDLSETQLTTIRDLLRFMLAFKSRDWMIFPIGHWTTFCHFTTKEADSISLTKLRLGLAFIFSWWTLGWFNSSKNSLNKKWLDSIAAPYVPESDSSAEWIWHYSCTVKWTLKGLSGSLGVVQEGETRVNINPRF